MDLQETKKSSPSAHESQGVHVCRNCGWPFPKPHPSAKHRRAHKRVCGTVEGYKLLKSDSDSDPLHLPISDDERLSDDDQQTPSPKEICKENVKEIGSSGGNALRSYRSEDDVFSDAVTEFSDSGVSPGLDEHKKSSKKVGADVHAALAINLTISKVPKDYETSGNTETSAGLFPTQPGKSPLTLTMIHNSVVDRTESSLSRIPETDCESILKLPQITEPDYLGAFNDNIGQKVLATNSAKVSDEPVFNWENDKQEKEEPITSVQVDNDLANNVEHCVDSEYIKSQEASDAAQLESKSIETKEQSVESGTPNWMVLEIGTEISYPLTIVESYLVDSKPLTASAVTENVVEKDKELVSQFIPIKEEVDLGVGSTGRNTGQLAELNELKKEENVDTMTSVTETVSARGNIAVDLKDYKEVLKSSITSDMGDTDDADPEENQSILSSDLGTLKKSCSNLNDNGDETQKGVLSPVELEVTTSGSSVTHDQGCSETISLLRDHDNQTLNDHQASRLYSVDAKTLNHNDSQVTTGEHLDVINVPSIGEEVFQNTTLNEDTKNVGVEFEKTKEGEQATNHTFELCPVVNFANHIDTNHDSVQQPPNSSESDRIKNANQVNNSTSDLKSLADSSTSCKCSDEYKQFQDVTVPNEGDDKTAKHLGASLVDMSVISSRRTDSLEGNWGSVSVLSSQSDVAAIVETGVRVVASDSHPTRKSEENSQNNAEECPNQNPAEEPTTEAVQAGNGSEGRKKDDIIAKVTNWRNGKQEHSPLKTLLNEETYAAAIPPPNELQQFSIIDQTAALKNIATATATATAVTTVSSIMMGSDMSIDDHAATNKDKELDSPARYPTTIKKDKKKGRPYWIPFVCCSSMHHDI